LCELIQKGQKLQAVKVAHEQLNIGLKDAKDLVEALEQGKPIDADKINSDSKEGELLSNAAQKASPDHRINQEEQGFFASKSRAFWVALAALVALALWLVYG